MQPFEIHITFEKPNGIMIAENFGLKTIRVDLLKPDSRLIRSEWMTSHVLQQPSYIVCQINVLKLARILEDSGAQVKRIKIESPWNTDYEAIALYIESHFIPKTDDYTYPSSSNPNHFERMSTDRTWDKNKFRLFRHCYRNDTVELCLYDDCPEEDNDWFQSYGMNSCSDQPYTKPSSDTSVE